MGHKNNDLPKGIGAALQSVSKLLGVGTAKERHLQKQLVQGRFFSAMRCL